MRVLLLLLWILFWPVSMLLGTPEEARERWHWVVIVSIVCLMGWWIVIAVLVVRGEIQ